MDIDQPEKDLPRPGSTRSALGRDRLRNEAYIVSSGRISSSCMPMTCRCCQADNLEKKEAREKTIEKHFLTQERKERLPGRE